MTQEVATWLSAGVGTIGTAGSIILAQAGAIDPSQAVVGLATYGPLGIVSLFLLWRMREKDREHAAERVTTTASIERLKDSTDDGNQTLSMILEHMRRQP